MTKRVLHIVDSLSEGDVAEQLRLLLTGLPHDEFDLHVCAFRDGPLVAELMSAGIGVEILPRRFTLDPWTLVRLKRSIARLQPDLVQTWLFRSNALGRMAAWQAGVRRLVAVERRLEGWKRWPHWELDRRLARRTAAIVASSAQVRDYYAAHGVRPQRYAIIPDGVPPPAPATGLREALLEELELPPSACLIGACVPLRPQSRIKDLVWAVDILKWVHDDAHLVIIGNGPQRRALLRYVDCVEVDDCVHFLGPRHDAAQLIGCFDFFWHAAARDGAAWALLQALSAGVPVVALDTPVHRALIVHGETGFLAEPNNRPAFARWTHRLLQEPVLREQAAQSGPRLVREQFTPARLVHNYRQLYEELLP